MTVHTRGRRRVGSADGAGDAANGNGPVNSGSAIPLRPHLYSAGILTAACLLLYLNTLDVPFYLDDFESIVRNPAMAGSLADVLAAHGMRAVTYASFWANLRLHGPEPAGFHLVNLLFHLANSLLVYALAWRALKPARQTVETRKPGRKRGAGSGRRAAPTTVIAPALFAALLFACHPLHTQAVTYVVQRAAELACLFYLAAILLYLEARSSASHRRRLWAAGLCALAALAALLSKQNAFTLPLALLLTEWLLVRRERQRLPRAPAGVIAAAVLVTLALLGWLAASGGADPGATLDQFTRDAHTVSRWEYFRAQQSVILMYLGKFLLPVALRLEYDLNIGSVGALATALGAAVHLALLALALRLRGRHRLISFGILFYYLTHLVESGLIPIKDLAFEHRSYLPDVGLVLVAAALVAQLLAVPHRRRVALLGCAVVVVLLAALTYQRNAQWRDPVEFYEREYRLSPEHPRVIANLSNRLIEAGERERAIEVLGASYARNPGVIPPQLASGYLYLFMQTRPAEQVWRFADRLLTQLDDPRARLPVLVNVGFMAMREGDFAAGERFLSEAITLPGAPIDAYLSLTIALEQQGKLGAARETLGIVLAREPGNELARQLRQRLQN